jgi:DNA-binding transcriptional LysR family regulator
MLTMPKRYAARLNVGFGNRILPLPIAAPTLDLHLYWHAAVEGPANRWLRGLVIESFAAHAPARAVVAGSGFRYSRRIAIIGPS